MSQDPSRPSLPTTSYAILGMLALRPWTAYELTQQLRRSLTYCWPKAESVLYDEPKRLVRLGLATAQRQPAGRRTRTAYAITDQGRRALGAWLTTRPGPPASSSRPCCDWSTPTKGPRRSSWVAVRAAHSWAEERYADGREQVRGYLDGGGPFPDRLHIIALFARFYADLFELVVRWAELAETEIQAWPQTDGLGMTERTRALLEELVRRPGAGQPAEREPSATATRLPDGAANG